MGTIYKTIFNSPIGVMEIEADETSLLSLHFTDKIDPAIEIYENSVTEEAKSQLEKYFSGRLRDFSLKLEIRGTDFQKKVWEALRKIPFGKTASYKDIARDIGNIKSVRAVGNANGKNRFPIVIPCHRVIYENGTIGGYSAGLWRKEYLLDLEKKID